MSSLGPLAVTVFSVSSAFSAPTAIAYGPAAGHTSELSVRDEFPAAAAMNTPDSHSAFISSATTGYPDSPTVSDMFTATMLYRSWFASTHRSADSTRAGTILFDASMTR